jgi:anti-sigma factor RsiW
VSIPSIPESHLAQEAIAALVDGELAPGPANRAARHLQGCLQCRLAVEAQREAKEALHGSTAEVPVPGDLLSRLRNIPFTADVPGAGGMGGLAAGPDQLTMSGSSGSWAVPLDPPRRAHRPHQARWLRRGVAGTLVGLGVGVTALALSLPADSPRSVGNGSWARPSMPEQHTEVVPPVVRTVTTGAPAFRAATSGGTP